MKSGKLSTIRSYIFSIEEWMKMNKGELVTVELNGKIMCFSRAGKDYEFKNERAHHYKKKVKD